MHLKGGAKDSLLYRTTAGLTLFGKANTEIFLLWYNFQCTNIKIFLLWYNLQHEWCFLCKIIMQCLQSLLYNVQSLCREAKTTFGHTVYSFVLFPDLDFNMTFSQTKYHGLNTPSGFTYGVREKQNYFIYSAKE